MLEKDSLFFLLGGYDLEMLTIRDILMQEGVAFADCQLRWDNAFLSQYQSIIQKLPNTTTIVGIELQEDISLHCNYLKIDHHNQYAHLPSALEQIVNLLNLPMNRYRQLVAINDKAYIPGMIDLGASKEEINRIRYADRQAQGVTVQDEELAEKAIAENMRQIGDLLLIHAYSSCFSPICDRLFPYRKLLIYTENEWMYYGEGACEVRNLFEKDNLFYGGGIDGYVGIKSHLYTKEEIIAMVELITNKM